METEPETKTRPEEKKHKRQKRERSGPFQIPATALNFSEKSTASIVVVVVDIVRVNLTTLTWTFEDHKIVENFLGLLKNVFENFLAASEFSFERETATPTGN